MNAQANGPATMWRRPGSRATNSPAPWGHNGESPLETWMQRNSLTKEDRERLLAEVERARPEVRQELRGVSCRYSKAANATRRAVQRACITRALVQRGFLSIRRRRFSPPIKRSLWARIS